MSVRKPIIQCERSAERDRRIHDYATALRDEAFGIGSHGFATEKEFWESGLFDSAVEKLRGRRSATQDEKQRFITRILTCLKAQGLVIDYSFQGDGERHDWEVDLPGGRKCVIEAKGCLDGNNTTIYERPANADEFLIWSLCQNAGADPQHNAWSGIHTRLSAEIIHKGQLVDGVIIWDMLCGNARQCPKLVAAPSRATLIEGDQHVPPPCIYLFPRSLPNPRNNPVPPTWNLKDQLFLHALSSAFKCDEDDVISVNIEARMSGADIERRTRYFRRGQEFSQSKWTKISRAR